MTPPTEPGGTPTATGPIGVVGAGVVGQAVVACLAGEGHSVLVASRRPARADVLAAAHQRVTSVGIGDALECPTVVLCHPSPHVAEVRAIAARGNTAVSVADDVDDIRGMLRTRAIVGAAMAPGLSGLLARHLVDQLDSADELHIALHGTGGPACARQHHVAMAGTSYSWVDGEWIDRPAGSGRELCWFPGAIGARDCYRAELSDPILLGQVFPEMERVSARMSATRRDRLTSRLPMLTPPHKQGAMGGLRVEARGFRGRSRECLVAGVAHRNGAAAGACAGIVASMAATGEIVVDRPTLLGDERLPTAEILTRLTMHGIAFEEFLGERYATAW